MGGVINGKPEESEFMTVSDMGIYWHVFFFMFGAMAGSFLNVCIVRMPRNKSIVFPSSHCPQCLKAVRWFDNIPLFSFLLLGMKCRDCHQPIAWRYFVVELLTAALFLWSYIVFGFSWALVPVFVLTGLLIVASFVDLEWRIIPDEVSVGGMCAGFILSMIFPVLHKGPAHNILSAGNITAIIMAGSCMVICGFNLWRRKLPLMKEDSQVFILAFSLLFLQWAAITLMRVLPFFAVSLAALADALQGAIIGGCSLWLTGLIGEVLISKRVVTEFDFKGVVEDPKALLTTLHKDGYVDARGNLQQAFRDVKLVADMRLSSVAETRRPEIYEILKSVEEGGVMGWGDVKLLAMAGAFLGWQAALIAFFIAPFFGVVFGVVKMIRRQDSAIAYGPFLAVGILVSLYRGDSVIVWVLSMYGMN
ncbi:MAG: prepilin peptidase [Candidatus Omnitrophota bacterium]